MPSQKSVKIIAVTAVIFIITVIIIGSIIVLSRKGSGTSNSTLTPVCGPIQIGKAPYWDEERKCIFFVDVYNSTVHKYVPSTNTHTFAKIGPENKAIAFIIPITNSLDQFIISYGSDIVKIIWDGNSSTISEAKVLASMGPNVFRANEGKVSPSGSLFVGTHGFTLPDGSVKLNNASLYAFYKNNTFKQILSNVSIANGMAWSKDQSKFYFIDSLAYNVQQFSYNKVDDTLSNYTELINFKTANITGLPDGMAIDVDGKLWIAVWEGHQVIQLDPENGSIMRKIDIDALQVTSVMFGGSDLSDFYVTTGRYALNDTILKAYPNSGYIYEEKNFGIQGYAGVPFKYY